ncbi:MAG TPA: GNAT family N-acetyltransferase, partial [Solirubrobacteraceae bacterium]|nr:GNAT family N-acetyltransferase [Solirubrobacteraceae bacterium]
SIRLSRTITTRVAGLPQRVVEVVPVDVVEREVHKPLPTLKPIPGAQIRCVSPVQAEDWRDLFPRERWADVGRSLARGDEGYLSVIEGRAAAAVWVSYVSHRDPWSGLHIRLAKEEAYTYGLQADPSHRRLGTGAAVVAAMLSSLQERGAIDRVYGWIDERNRESQALLRMVFGFTQVQTVKHARVLDRVGWQVPGSDRPSYGPVSHSGRHSVASRR